MIDFLPNDRYKAVEILINLLRYAEDGSIEIHRDSIMEFPLGSDHPVHLCEYRLKFAAYVHPERFLYDPEIEPIKVVVNGDEVVVQK